MDKRIGLESRGKLPNQVTDLCLDNARTAGEFEGLTDEFTSLESLSAINTGLTTLKGFPKLKNLVKLEVSENRLSGSLQALKECTKLQHLNLCKNKFKTLEALEPLKSLETLEHLEVLGNDIYPSSDSHDATEKRKRIFEMLPNLKWVDSFDQNGVEQEDADDDDDDDHPVGNGLNHVSDDDDDDEDDEDGDDEDGAEYSSEDEEEGEQGPGLADLYNNVIINDEEDDGDYDEEDGDGEEEMVEEEEEGEPEHPVRGKKRKLDDPAEGAT